MFSGRETANILKLLMAPLKSPEMGCFCLQNAKHEYKELVEVFIGGRGGRLKIATDFVKGIKRVISES